MVVAAVAAGAFAAAGQSLAAGEGNASPEHDEFNPADGAATFSSAAGESEHDGKGGSAPAPDILPVANTSDADPSEEVEKLTKSARITEEREAARIAAEEEARKPDFTPPADGWFTSGFGGRWGTTHYGIDIANAEGTPINSVADGVIIEAGSASGFGMWVRVQHEDGTITVYGHVNTITVNEGDSVEAGEQIATMGNRGFSTGTHLHFEVWDTDGKKINPLPWMQERDISPV
ncbi:M23 family metallopeptidase [Saccharopolyspora montiporae]|uniref:M23 family metallopeptidase n=1 Tax=Saccharopolyspora montiporae TaxID=2781240 RepID=UPI00351C7F3F